MKKIIIANWKMNKSFDEAQNWIENLSKKLSKNILDQTKIVLCPPLVMIDFIDGLLMENELSEIEKLKGNIEQIREGELEKLIEDLRKINLGAQDCSASEKGAFTGDVSAAMVKDSGAEYVILGHSERRQFYHETDDVVAKKIDQAVRGKLIPILCIGESKEQRDKNEFKEFLRKQIENSIPQNLKIEQLILAYEPIWSIGTGVVPTCGEIAETLEFIREELLKNKNISGFKILYGGSANAENSKEILETRNVDGLLVGGASLDAEGFYRMIC